MHLELEGSKKRTVTSELNSFDSPSQKPLFPAPDVCWARNAN